MAVPSTPDAWRPDQYDRFHAERSAPFRALLALVGRRPALRVLDLGCGTGEHTAILHDELGARATLGIDLSAGMLAKAQERARPGLGFARADAAVFAPAVPVDLVFSNAALHWLPDHPALLARLARFLAPGGELAVQVPANHFHASHTAAAEIAGEEPFRSALAGYRRESPVLAAGDYERALAGAGLVDACAEECIFEHLLGARGEVVEWVKGTTLLAYETRLAPELYARFLARYRERLFAELPDERPFRFAFRRILFTARRPGGDPAEQPTRVFVYGTLLGGEHNHGLLGGSRCAGAARTRESFAMFDLGGHPCIVRGEGEPVAGEVYEVDAATLARLDAFEDHPRWYRREPVHLADGTCAQAYLFAQDVGSAPRVRGGDWRRRPGVTPPGERA